MLGYITASKAEGATLIVGGEPYKDISRKGFFITLIMFTGVKDSMIIFHKEVLGRLLSLLNLRAKRRRSGV
jgi:aldehyde dehydrogenase (NAD+)